MNFETKTLKSSCHDVEVKWPTDTSTHYIWNYQLVTEAPNGILAFSLSEGNVIEDNAWFTESLQRWDLR